MNKSFVEEIRMRTFRYFYEDGLVEMAIGGQFAIIGLALWAIERYLSGAFYAGALSLGLFALILGGVFGVKWVVGTLKNRITYPRTGKVTYGEQSDGGRWKLVAVIAFFAISSFFLPAKWTGTSVMVGVLMAAMLLYMGNRVGLKRMQFAASMPLLAGILSGAMELGDIQGTASVFLTTGVVLTIIGLAVMRNYLQMHPNEAGES